MEKVRENVRLPAVMYWNSLFGTVPLEARRTAFSVALAIFWRMRDEVQQTTTVAPGHDKNDSGRGVAPQTSKRFEPRRL